MVIEEEKKLEEAQKKAEENRKQLFNNYITDGKKIGRRTSHILKDHTFLEIW